MSRVSFNRNRVKLKQLLGIRARLALLALILVAPLMLERARSLEDTRAKQIAAGRRGIRQPRAAQRRHPARSHLLGRDDVEIGGLYPRFRRRHRPQLRILRASLPANLPWIRSCLIVGGDGRVQCSTNNVLVGLDLSDRAYFKKAREDRRLRLQRLSVRQDHQQADRDGGLSGRRHQREVDAVILAGVNLDWMSKIMSNLGGRPGISAVLVDSDGNGAGGARGSGQHDRPVAGYHTAVVGHR